MGMVIPLKEWYDFAIGLYSRVHSNDHGRACSSWVVPVLRRLTFSSEELERSYSDECMNDPYLGLATVDTLPKDALAVNKADQTDVVAISSNEDPNSNEKITDTVLLSDSN
ncbi:uncharacterized protein C8R40DRAFT_1176200 [Lentinula edodes]|uniref:uncharacterized protein n=1 Tax=Lentinula edodes TaxID=5353 RepID=UPI001E8D68F9|nr:uncharacterized protein C8R40DRAFT_1176200 [Lentinula edodes]KAH7869877.1 hypothetical protein C8R40DRAFT_1176200 [Lentinula edodes]